jgi:hypothetical protein
MKTSPLLSRIALVAAMVVGFAALAAPRALAQSTPKTLDAVQDIAADGSVALTISMSFDAAAWKTWKAQVGDEPARLRAMMKHQFSAYALEDFKLEKNDLERTAKITMRSASGLELRRDGSFRIPVEKYFRLVNSSGREWFFSGNNPHAANSLNTVKLVLPANAREAQLVNAGTGEQGLIFRVEVPAGRSRTLVLAGGGVLAVGLALLAAAVLLKPKTAQAVSA